METMTKESSPAPVRNKSKSKRFIGFLLVNLTTLGYCCSNFLYVYLCNKRGHSPYEIFWFRGLFNLVLSYIVIWHNKSPLLSVNSKEMTFINYRNFYLIGVSVIFMYALKSLPVSTVTVIYYISPLFTIILSHFVLEERMALMDVILSVVGLLGIVVIMKPPFIFGGAQESSMSVIGYVYVGLVVLSALLNAMLIIDTKRLKCKVGTDILSFYFGFWLSVVISIYLVMFPPMDATPYTLADWGCLIACVAGFSLAIIFLHLAIKVESASVIGIITYSQILYTFIIELMFLGQKADIYSIVGSLLIVGSSMSVLIRKAMTTGN
jgi:drug/metabolite transporter (DMT)-like permease